MKQQIILRMSRISVGVVASILCLFISLVVAAFFGDGLESGNENTEVALVASCLMFAVAFCLWLYG